MSTIGQRIHAWLADNGPARLADIRAGLPDIDPPTLKNAITRLRNKGMITRDDDGIWTAVILEMPEPEPDTAGRIVGEDQAAAVLEVLPWDAMLGAEVPGVRCDDSCDLGCSSPPFRYTGDHTAIVCPECGPDCWDISPAASRRIQGHKADLRAKSARTGSASAALSQSELDQQAIELNRRKRDALEEIAAELRRQEVRGDVRHDLMWLHDQYTAAETTERCDELDEWFGEIDLPRRPIGKVIRGFFGRGADDDDGIVDAELVDDDEDQDDKEWPEPEPPRALPAAPPPGALRSSGRPPRPYPLRGDPIRLHARVVAETTAGSKRVAELSKACERAGRQPTTREIYEAAGLEWNGA